MIIKAMKASFGGLENASMELQPGLNIIEAPNEAGKSTWCAFIRTMLYGIDTARRGRSGELTDKKRYLPWGNYPMAGSMDISWRGGEVTLRRSGAAGKPMGACEANLSGTAEKLPELCGKAPGEIILGVPESVFLRSAFISGGAMAVDGDGELEKRIAALVTSGSEDESYSAARDILHDLRVKRRYNSRMGRAAELEGLINEKKAALADIERENARLGGVYEQRKNVLGEISRLERELRLHEAVELTAKNRQAAEAKAARKAAAEELKRLREQGAGIEREMLSAAREAVSEYREAAAVLKAAAAARDRRKAAEAELAKAETDISEGSGRKPGAAGLLLVILSVVCAALWLALHLPLWAGIVAAVLFAAGAVLSAVCIAARRSSRKESRMKLEAARMAVESMAGEGEVSAAVAAEDAAAENLYAALTAIGIDPGTANIPAALEEKENLLARIGRSEAEFAAAVRLAESMGEPAAVSEELPAPAMEKAAARRMLESAREAGAVLERELALSEGRLRHLGDPLVLATELEDMERAYAENEEEYEALSLAIEVLDEANAELQQRFSPIVGSLAAKLMSAMTEGRYDSVGFDRKFSLTAALKGETGRDAAYLSAGTSAQLYLALRLAICLLALPEEEKCPIILDDALLGFDDKRAKAALELLRELSKERQIILFTCQSREKTLLDM